MKHTLTLLFALLLAGCGGGPTVPDWQIEAQTAVERYTRHFLEGHVKLSESSFAKARAAVAATGDVAAVAHMELVRCGLRAAVLDFAPCIGYTELAALRTTPEDAAYHRFISGDWRAPDRERLPPHYAAYLSAAGQSQAEINRAIAAIADPVSRLIATGLTVRRGRFDAATLQAAVDTAARAGWRRPLLTYLALQENHTSDPAARAALRAQIRLVEESMRRAEVIRP